VTLPNRAPAPRPQDIAAGGEWLEWMPGERFALRVPSAATQGRYTMLEVTAVPRCGPPLHIHRNEDEHFIILEGTVRFVRGDRVFDASAGTTVTVPKGVRHTWSVVSDGTVRMLLVFTPGGFDDCFLELVGSAKDQAEGILARHGCTVVGPAICE